MDASQQVCNQIEFTVDDGLWGRIMRYFVNALVKFWKTDTTGDPATVAWKTLKKLGVIIFSFIMMPLLLDTVFINHIQSESLKPILNFIITFLPLIGLILIFVYNIINDPVYYLPKTQSTTYRIIRVFTRYVMPVIGIGILISMTIVIIVRMIVVE